MTNAEKIKSMCDEQLASFLCKISTCDEEHCPAYYTCMRTKDGSVLKWIKQEAEDK